MSHQHKMPKVGSKRQTKVGVYLIREKRKSDMQRGIEQGLHFVDAADRAGIPYEVAMGAVATDEEFQGWWRLSSDRPRLAVRKNMVEKQNPMQIKKDFVNKLANAGLFEKIPQMVEEADPSTPEGKEVLGFMIKYLIKDILPKEVASKVEHTQKEELHQLSDEELVKLLHERRDARQLALEEKDRADQARLSYEALEASQEVEDIDE